jgi:hydrogenase nickel incorporation protein HypA/HybF
MHELSIAESLAELVRRHTPQGMRVRSLTVRIGPMQGIEPESLEFGWKAVTDGTDLAGAQLVMELLRWELSCPDCGRRWESDDLYVACVCGCATPRPQGGDELDLMSIEAEDPASETAEANG